MINELKRLPGYIYKKLTEDLYDGVYFVNRNRRILFWNKRAGEISGYKKPEMLGKRCYNNILRHIDKNGRKLCLTKYCPLLISMNSGKPYAERVYLRRKDGVRIPVDTHVNPIKRNGKTIGAVEVFRDASLYERIERQRERSNALTLTDALTSLPNRRYLDRKLISEINKFKKYGDDLHVAIVDIDHFKKINDTYGHKKGDYTLRKVSSIIEDNLRATDLIGRYGGEEFLIILPNTPRDNCCIALERIRGFVEKAKFEGIKGPVTVSIGASRVNKGDNPDTVFKRSDKMLYEAKNGGRNRVRAAKVL